MVRYSALSTALLPPAEERLAAKAACLAASKRTTEAVP